MRQINGLIRIGHRANSKRISWKQVLGSVFGAAARLHHYRDVHTRMMRSAFCELDCRSLEERCNDE